MILNYSKTFAFVAEKYKRWHMKCRSGQLFFWPHKSAIPLQKPFPAIINTATQCVSVWSETGAMVIISEQSGANKHARSVGCPGPMLPSADLCSAGRRAPSAEQFLGWDRCTQTILLVRTRTWMSGGKRKDLSTTKSWDSRTWNIPTQGSCTFGLMDTWVGLVKAPRCDL